MPIDVGAAIAQRSIDLLGVSFRIGGRREDTGLDCVGLVAAALAEAGGTFDIPSDYTLRGEYQTRILAFFDRGCFLCLTAEKPLPGDILLCQTAPRQLHFAISTSRGLVHAHAGLRRVVLTPFPLPWPIIGHWRYIGD